VTPAVDGLRLVVHPASPVPPFEQLRTQVVAQVRSGTLSPGTRLPTVRWLAADLGIAPNTVARTYRELERDGVLETRGRNGTFVAATGDVAQRAAHEAATQYVVRLRRLGLDADETLALVRSVLEA